MRTRKAKRLVIDPSVLLAAGLSEHPTSRRCRLTLDEIRDVRHHIVLSETIRYEIYTRPVERGHKPSVYSLVWLASMTARKQIAIIRDVRDNELRSKINASNLTDRCRIAIEEDIHLIEAAVNTDRRVLSIDREVYRCLTVAAERVGELRSLYWADPVQFHEATVEWLRSGAPDSPQWRLGINESD